MCNLSYSRKRNLQNFPEGNWVYREWNKNGEKGDFSLTHPPESLGLCKEALVRVGC